MKNAEIRQKADYQQFTIGVEELHPIGRMVKKLEALKNVLPNFEDKTVLDVGCDFGFWSFKAAMEGGQVLGLDRSRHVRGLGPIDLIDLNNETAIERDLKARFLTFNLGKQWWDFGKYDIVLLMSLYHHIYQNTGGNHESIWFWLSKHVNQELIWENPVDTTDPVAKRNIDPQYHANYTEEKIKEVALKYFHITYEGPAIHEPHRVVWILVPKEREQIVRTGNIKSGAGGATKAFLYNNAARIHEIADTLGETMKPGSMNVHLSEDFDWDSMYYRADLKDVIKRSAGLKSPWKSRKVRYYPMFADGLQAWALRFEGEKYPLNFVELISYNRLNIGQKTVEVSQ
jgi:SAM-dependent methyltransferase